MYLTVDVFSQGDVYTEQLTCSQLRGAHYAPQESKHLNARVCFWHASMNCFG